MWGPDQTITKLPTLDPLRALAPTDTTELSAIYRSLLRKRHAEALKATALVPSAQEAASLEVVADSTGENASGYSPFPHTITLNALDPSVALLRPESWMVSLQATFWHELGHSLFSQAIVFGDDPTGLPLQLLEDLRLERRLLEVWPLRPKPWLRANLDWRYPDADAVFQFATQVGWVTALTVLAGRQVSGVLDSARAEWLVNLAPLSRAQLKTLTAIWQAYIVLDDLAYQSQLGLDLIAELDSLIRAET